MPAARPWNDCPLSHPLSPLPVGSRPPSVPLGRELRPGRPRTKPAAARSLMGRWCGHRMECWDPNTAANAERPHGGQGHGAAQMGRQRRGRSGWGAKLEISERLEWGWQIFSVKSHTLCILGFADRPVLLLGSVCSTQATARGTQTGGRGLFQVNFIYNNRRWEGIGWWAVVCRLLAWTVGGPHTGPGRVQEGEQRDQAAMKLSQGWALSREAIKGALIRQWSSKGHFSIGVVAGGCCHGPEAEQYPRGDGEEGQTKESFKDRKWQALGMFCLWADSQVFGFCMNGWMGGPGTWRWTPVNYWKLWRRTALVSHRVSHGTLMEDWTTVKSPWLLSAL